MEKTAVRPWILPALTAVILSVLISCSSEPRPIKFGVDACEYCKMTLIDSHHGAEIVTRKGKTYVFDAIECMAAYEIKGQIAEENILEKYVVNMDSDTPELIPVSQAYIIHTQKLASPMGLNLVAVRDRKIAEDIALMYYGNIKDWEEVRHLVKSKWF